MHLKNMLKKAVVLALSLVCTRGVAMEQEEARPPRSCVVDFFIEYSGQNKRNIRAAAIIRNVTVAMRPQMTNYLIKTGIKEVQKQRLMIRNFQVKQLFIDGFGLINMFGEAADDHIIERTLFDGFNLPNNPAITLYLGPVGSSGEK
jgi:hypothetical protein